MKIALTICRILVGVIFLISGFTKAIDPVGTAIKLQEYFLALGLDALSPYALIFSIILNTLEFLVGFTILVNIKLRLSSIIALILMLIFIPLTLYLAITGKVTDCGCFGDAIKLSDWETFYKNIFLIIPILILIFFRKRFTCNLKKLGQLLIILTGVLFVAFITLYGYIYLPLIDFRPFHIGANIIEKTAIADGNQPETKQKFYYEKDGKVVEFDETNYPWNDTSWHFVEQKIEIIGEIYEPPLKDFLIEHPKKGDITSQIIEDENISFLLVSKDLKKGCWKSLDKIKAIARFCKTSNVKFYGVTSSTPDEITSFIEDNKIEFPICFADEKMIKTIIRSNPGLILLQQGNVLGKWSYANIPNAETFFGDAVAYSLNKSRKKNNKLFIYAIVISLAFIIVLIKFLFKKILN